MRSPAARVSLPAAVAIVVLLVAAAATVPPATAQEPVEGGTTIAIEIAADGDAHVTVTHEFVLTSDEEVEAFRQMAQEHRSGAPSHVSIQPFERAADGAASVTGREMAIRDVSRTADRTNRTGRLAASFTWTNFARVDDDQILLGDVFQSPSGTWLPRLEPDQELLITFPEGYAVKTVSRPLQNGAIHVEGPATFSPRNPSAVLAGASPPWWSGTLPIVGGLLLVLAVVGALLFLFRDRLPALPLGDGSPGGDGDGADATGLAETASDPESPLLSDEERVLRLLEAEGGRMKQVDIVEATDWSNAKVSQLLSEMAEDGEVDKLRIGRENLISLPGKGPGDE